MRISDWSSDVCSSDLSKEHGGRIATTRRAARALPRYSIVEKGGLKTDSYPFLQACMISGVAFLAWRDAPRKQASASLGIKQLPPYVRQVWMQACIPTAIDGVRG